MDYKKLIKSRSIRLKILRLFAFVPDVWMVKLQYRIKTGRKLNLKNPERFTEKLQWYKLFYKNPLMVQCVDKYEVRDFVRIKGLEGILVPCYGIYDDAIEIKWDELPDRFVIKDTLGGGGNAVIVVKEKGKEDKENLMKRISEWTRIDAHKKDGGREWPYYSGKNHRILIEEYLEADESKGGLIDYKFFCFDGKVKFIYVIADRQLGQGVGLAVFDSGFNLLDVCRNDERPLQRKISMPENYEEMKKTAEVLSEGFPEARIDLYNVDGNIKFGEITFYDGSGYMTFTPDSFDEEAGKCFFLPKGKKNEDCIFR